MGSTPCWRRSKQQALKLRPIPTGTCRVSAALLGSMIQRAMGSSSGNPMIRAPSDSLTEGLSDASRGKPEGDGRDDDHRPLVDRAFLVARRQPTPLFQAVDAPFHDVATFVDRLAVSQGTTGPERTPR